MNLSGAMTWLAAKKFTSDGVAATYVRAAVELEITVAKGQSHWEQDDEQGAIINMETPDFFVRAVDIVTLGRPVAGDKVVIGDDTFSLMSPTNKAVWQWADWPNKTVYRVHAKQTD